jgi:serine/threonine protein kinase
MPLLPGSKVGVFEIVGSLGAGGMVEVYRAVDSKLNRPVALKVLPELFATDRDRLARFRREAQLLASIDSSSRCLCSIASKNFDARADEARGSGAGITYSCGV